MSTAYGKMDKTFIAYENAKSGEIIISEALANNVYSNSYSDAESLIGQLVSILLENAFKYSNENGTIDLSLSSNGKTVKL